MFTGFADVVNKAFVHCTVSAYLLAIFLLFDKLHLKFFSIALNYPFRTVRILNIVIVFNRSLKSNSTNCMYFSVFTGLEKYCDIA